MELHKMSGWSKTIFFSFKLVSLTLHGELRKEDNCAEVNDNGKKEMLVIMNKCHDNGENQKWKHEMVCYLISCFQIFKVIEE